MSSRSTNSSTTRSARSKQIHLNDIFGEIKKIEKKTFNEIFTLRQEIETQSNYIFDTMQLNNPKDLPRILEFSQKKKDNILQLKDRLEQLWDTTYQTEFIVKSMMNLNN